MNAHGAEGNFVACKTYEELKAALQPPRPVLLMVKAGEAVDGILKDLLPNLEPGDILIDAGNSHYRDTERREKALAESGFHFFGMGVSGGEEGALKGPSMMPGGKFSAYQSMETLLQKMAADDGIGGSCVTHVGTGGAGHFVKMVHNGIEYGMMQLIAEVYDVLKALGRVTNDELAEVFTQWSRGDDIGSFLTEITAQIFRKKDAETGKHLVDLIADEAGQKGTGKWTTEAAMDLGVAIPTITAAVDARILSGDKAMRSTGKHMPFQGLPFSIDPRVIVAQCRSALELSMLLAYIQGFELIRHASEEHTWDINLSEVARIWRGGCIIRSVMLPTFEEAFKADGDAARDAILDRFSGKRQENWRSLVTLAAGNGVPVPAMAASLSYYDTYRRDRLPQALIQAQRDFFGAHTFQRVDKEGSFHADWHTP
jgi:6-phosphogluconate dehydrogenase